MVKTAISNGSPSITASTIGDQAVIIGRACRQLKVSPEKLFDHFSIRISDATAPFTRLPANAMGEIWNIAEMECGADFRRAACGALDSSFYHLLTPLLLSSRSLAEALVMASKYSTVISTAAVFETVETEGQIGLLMLEERETKSHAAVDLLRVYLKLVAQTIQPDPALIERVEFRCPESDFDRIPWKPNREVLEFDCTANIIWFNKELSLRPSVLSGKTASQIEAYVSSYVDGLKFRNDWLNQARHWLAKSASSEGPSLKNLARFFNTSERSLQRRLRESGTCLRNEVNHTKCVWAHKTIAIGASLHSRPRGGLL